MGDRREKRHFTAEQKLEIVLAGIKSGKRQPGSRTTFWTVDEGIQLLEWAESERVSSN